MGHYTPIPSGGLSREDMILQIKYGADIIMAMKSVMGHEDLAFLISASVNKLAPDKTVSGAVDTAEVHAVLIGFSRLKP